VDEEKTKRNFEYKSGKRRRHVLAESKGVYGEGACLNLGKVVLSSIKYFD